MGHLCGDTCMGFRTAESLAAPGSRQGAEKEQGKRKDHWSSESPQDENNYLRNLCFGKKKIIIFKGVCIFSVFPHFCSMLEFSPLLVLITADLGKLSRDH